MGIFPASRRSAQTRATSTQSRLSICCRYSIDLNGLLIRTKVFSISDFVKNRPNHLACFAAKEKAIYSASVVDVETARCFQRFHKIDPPPSETLDRLLIRLRSLQSPVQFASEYQISFEFINITNSTISSTYLGILQRWFARQRFEAHFSTLLR